MRKLVHITLLFLLPAMFNSCQKIKSIFDVEFDTQLSGTLYIDVDDPVQKSTDAYSFHHEVMVSPLDDKEIAEYEENIKQIDVAKIVATITDVNKEDVEFEKGTKITVKGSSEITWTLAESWPIVTGDEIVLGDEASVAVYKSVAQMISDMETLTIIASGTCNQTEVYVTLVVGIDLKVTANPL